MFTKFATIQVILIALAPFTAHAARHCNPLKSKPCGMSCISKDFTCHKPTPSQGAATVATPANSSKASK